MASLTLSPWLREPLRCSPRCAGRRRTDRSLAQPSFAAVWNLPVAEAQGVDLDLQQLRRDGRAFAIRASAAITSAVPPRCSERAPPWPPPRGTRAVSPCTSLKVSTGRPSLALATCAKLVSWPCPFDCVPTAMSIEPVARTVSQASSLGWPRDVSRKAADAEAAQLAALPGCPPALCEAGAIGREQDPVEILREFAAIDHGAEGAAMRKAPDEVALAQFCGIDPS
jgi:hypothetical protein